MEALILSRFDLSDFVNACVIVTLVCLLLLDKRLVLKF